MEEVVGVKFKSGRWKLIVAINLITKIINNKNNKIKE